MSQSVRDIMTKDPIALDAGEPVIEAARRMKEADIGDVIVLDGDQVCGIVTDRDIVIRAVADQKDVAATKLGEICSRDLTSVAPDADVGEAVRLMSDKAIRRLPVIENGRPVGVLSIGDLAIERDPDSALADISAARPTD